MSSSFPGSYIMTTWSSALAPPEQMIPGENESAERLSPASYTIPTYSNPVTGDDSESVQSSPRIIQQRHPSLDHSSPSNVEAAGTADVHFVNIEPPITNLTLGQLDCDQLYSNLLLRHDLNFDPNIQYRPVTDGDLGSLRMLEASEYWNAMSSELARWLMRKDNARARTSKRCRYAMGGRSSGQNKQAPQVQLTRLPRMFDTVRQILKGLLPEEEWPTIDRRFDISLLVQQLENNAANFVELSEWLGFLLQRFCSPARHHMITSMTSTIRDGIHKRDVGRLLSGLMQIFEILETMKLGYANQSIRSWRFVMIDNTVDFEQKDFLERIAKGWDVNPARSWFAKQRQERRMTSGIHTLAASITELIISDSDHLPPTLTLDYLRIRSLQLQLDRLMYQAACRWTFEETSESLGLRSIPRSSYDNLHSRIAVLTSDGDSRAHPSRKTENITLEIVREAYRVSNIDRIPTPEDLESAESNLLYATDTSTNVSKQLRSYLAEDLHQLVEEEVQAAKNLTPVQMSTRFVLDNLAHTRRVTEQSDMLRFAQQIAHISVLHWRVWAPILYDLPEEDP